MAADELNTTISFRLPPAEHAELMRLAEAAGTTKHQFARTLVVQGLSVGGHEQGQTDLPRIEDGFGALQHNLGEFRVALGRGIAAILQHVAKDRSKEEIRRWVFERIISPVDSSGTEREDS